jgi:hypothetical protein
MAGYSSIGFWKWALAAGIVALPLLLAGDSDWAPYYVVVVLLGFALTQKAGMTTFLNFLTAQLGSK